MREILFRGKRLDGCGWIYGSLLQNEDMSVIVVEFEEAAYCGGIADCPYTHGVIGFEVDPETVGQYTGLKDKNGEKIYEGDIVKTLVNFGPAGNEERILPVEITPFGINAQHWVFKEEGCLPEVIGNIYDNPELLEVET